MAVQASLKRWGTIHRATEDEARELADGYFSKYGVLIDDSKTDIYDDNGEMTRYVKVQPEKVEKIVEEHLVNHKVAEEYRKKLKTKCPSVEQNVGNLSGGNQQKVLLAVIKLRLIKYVQRRQKLVCFICVDYLIFLCPTV